MERHDGTPLSPGPSVEVEVSIRIAPGNVFRVQKSALYVAHSVRVLDHLCADSKRS